MSDTLDVSVVMGVYNGALHLRKTIESILCQEGVSLEFIIVDDGSTDESPRILDEYARRDLRVQVIRQENQGLTRALIKGCAAAKGTYIARQDAGDVSLPGRLRQQLAFIGQHPNAALVSCGARFVGPNGEHLHDVALEPEKAQAGLLTLQLDTIRGPSHHGSTFFPRTLYEQVGGYRACFYFAQDLDLWIRMVEMGEYLVMPKILYQASVSVGSISGLYRREQVNTLRLILESARLRRQGRSDSHILEKAQIVKLDEKRGTSRLARARAYYFIGSCLKKNNDPEADKYLKSALMIYPLHLKSAVRLLLG